MRHFDSLKECMWDGLYCYFGNAVDIDDYTWAKFLQFYQSHPENVTTVCHKRNAFTLQKLEQRASLPAFSRQIIDDLKQAFPTNQISNIAFGGIDDNSKSFEIHRDPMDVLYLQVLGKVEWSFWEAKDESYVDDHNIDIKHATKIHTKTLYPGDMVYVPRMQFHHVKPYGPRVGFSHGIEGDDPSIL